MGLLADRFREEVAKVKNMKMDEAVADVMYPTGFLPFDFMNGYKIHVPDNVTGEDYYYNSVGIVDGSSNMFIGRTGSGKTTIVLQMAANIIRKFPTGVIFYDDIEGGSNNTRRELLTQFSPEEIDQRIIYRNSSVTAENFYKRISIIYEEKTSKRADYEYDTELYDSKGNKIYKLIPTIYILDSLAMLTPDKLTEEEELSGQMSSTATARVNSQVFKRIVPKLKAANIILFVINHINDKIEINPFMHTKAQIGYLKQGETLPGGKVALYLANNMIRVDDGTKLKESDGLGVEGRIVEFEIIKSRTTGAGHSVPMVFTNDHGFDDILSLFVFLKSTGAIVTGQYCYLKGFEDMKFKQKNFKQKLISDPNFTKAFETVAKSELEKLISTNIESTVNTEHEINQNIINSILNI